jgi:hypothetical protein
VLACVLLSAAVSWAGWHGAVAGMVGMVGTGVFLYGTWVVVKLTGSTATAGGPTRPQVVVMVVALLMKLPLIYVGWVAAQSLGPFGPTWFLLGLALVYCVVIWRAVLAVRD